MRDVLDLSWGMSTHYSGWRTAGFRGVFDRRA
jgi:hypothetical protein